jgi:RimJ/RimL family protein N-acetyltransferase
MDATVTSGFVADVDLAGLSLVCSQPECYSGWVNGRLVGCGGLIEQWRGRALIWGLVAKGLRRHEIGAMLLRLRAEIDRAMTTYNRLECTVLDDFEAGHRFVKALGFVYEGTMARYDWWGRDHRLYARTQPSSQHR